jgi:hypothetical protein
MFKTINDLDYDIKSISFKESLELSLVAGKMNSFEFYAFFVEKVTTLDMKQVNNLLVQDIFAILLEYLFQTFDNPQISEIPQIYAKDFLTNNSYEEKIITINKFRFSNTNITLKKAIDAEKYCYLSGDADLLSIYIMASSCLKGLKSGVDTLLMQDDCKNTREDIKALNSILKIGFVDVDFLVDLKSPSLLDKKNRYASLENEFFFYT